MERTLIQHGFPPGIWLVLILDAFQHIFAIMYKTRVLENMMALLKVEYFESRNLGSATTFISGAFSFYGGWLADSYFGKYMLFMLSFCLLTFVHLPLIIAVMIIPVLQHDERRQNYLFAAELVYSFFIFGIILKKPLIAEQFKLPEMLNRFELYLFYDFWLQNIGTVVVFALLPLYNITTNCFSTYCFGTPYIIGFIISIIYLIAFLKLHSIFYLKKRYKHIVNKIIYCIFLALRRNNEIKNSENWLDNAFNYCKIEIRNNTKYFVRLLMILFVCAPYWVLRENVVFSWLYQANIMDLDVYFFYVYPITVNAVPAFINILLLPIAYKWVYHLGDTFHRSNLQFKRFAIGYCLIGCAYLCAGFVNIFIERTESMPLQLRKAQLKIYNGLPFTIYIHSPWIDSEIALQPYDLKMFDKIPTIDGTASASTVIFNKERNYSWVANVRVYERQSVTYIVKKEGLLLTDGFDNVYHAHAVRPKVILYCANHCGKGTVSYFNQNTLINYTMTIPNGKKKATIKMFGLGKYILYINRKLRNVEEFRSGEVHSLLLYMNEDGKLMFRTFRLVGKNYVTILYILPQYIFLSLADVFGYVSFNILLYLESPPNLRGFCYCINEMFRYVGYGFLFLGEYFSPLRISSVMFNKSLSIFIAFFIYLFIGIKFKIKMEYED